MKYEDIKANEEEYQERMDELTPEGTTMGTVLLPDEDTSEELLSAFHELMMDHEFVGIEYAQEALHGEGADYFTRFFEFREEVMSDFVQYKNIAEEPNA